MKMSSDKVQRTLAMIKPNAIEHTNDIIKLIKDEGFVIIEVSFHSFRSYIHYQSFWEFINKLIEIFQLIMVGMIPFVANAIFICSFAMNCLVLIRKIN